MRVVVAFSAVGSLREEIRPRDFVVPGQVIDRTKGVRPWTFFEEGVVAHVSSSYSSSMVISLALLAHWDRLGLCCVHNFVN